MRPCHPTPATAPRAVAVLLLALATTSCSGSEPAEEPLASAAEASPTAASRTPTASPTRADDEQALRILVRDYDEALAGVRRTKARDGSLDAVATADWSASVLGGYRENVYDRGMVLLGDETFRFLSVRVSGDTADVAACLDARELYLVEQGSDVTDDTRGQARSRSSIAAVREPDGRWLVDGIETQPSATC